MQTKGTLQGKKLLSFCFVKELQDQYWVMVRGNLKIQKLLKIFVRKVYRANNILFGNGLLENNKSKGGGKKAKVRLTALFS